MEADSVAKIFLAIFGISQIARTFTAMATRGGWFLCSIFIDIEITLRTESALLSLCVTRL